LKFSYVGAAVLLLTTLFFTLRGELDVRIDLKSHSGLCMIASHPGILLL
jgi:hypothetical protein